MKHFLSLLFPLILISCATTDSQSTKTSRHPTAIKDVKNNSAHIYYLKYKNKKTKPIGIEEGNIHLVEHLPKRYIGEFQHSSVYQEATYYNNSVLSELKKRGSVCPIHFRKMYTKTLPLTSGYSGYSIEYNDKMLAEFPHYDGARWSHTNYIAGQREIQGYVCEECNKLYQEHQNK